MILITWFRQLPTQRQIAYASVLAVTLALLVGAMRIYEEQDMRALPYGGLGLDEVGAMVQKLESSGLRVQTAGGGTRIMVRSGEVDRALITLSAAGLPKGGGLGFELFDRGGGGLPPSEAEQRSLQQRALQGELSRTLGKLDGVASASVIIAPGQESLFAKSEVPPTASVFLVTRGGEVLADAQVRTIAHLVSRAVPKLRVENIAITDASGHDYSEKLSGGAGGSTTRQLEVQRAYERDLARDVQSLLAPVLGGNGKVSVKVAAVLDWTALERTTTAVGDEPVTLSSETKTETFKGNGSSGASGIAGAVSNLPGAGAATGSGARPGNQDYQTETRIVQSEVTRTVEKITRTPGSVTRQSVSVFVDQPEGTTMDSERIKAAVQAAIGFDAARSDQVTVVALPFDTSAAGAARAAAAKAQEDAQGQQRIQYAGALLVVAALGVFVWRMWRSGPPAAYAPRRSRATALASEPALVLPDLSGVGVAPAAASDDEAEEGDDFARKLEAFGAKMARSRHAKDLSEFLMKNDRFQDDFIQAIEMLAEASEEGVPG